MNIGAQRLIESTCILETVIIKNTPIAAKISCLVASAQELPLFCWYEKTLEAERRSYHTFFDVHVVETRDGYILIEDGDYGELPMHLIDQIVYTATGKMADEF